MYLLKALRAFLTISLVCRSDAFLPGHAGLTLPSTDYTLTDITVQGIVRAVAKYFEDTNRDRYRPGDLTNMSPLTPSRLFKEHYEECGHSTKFERAIQAILKANIKMSKTFGHKAVWHFNGNTIEKGNQRIIQIRDILLSRLRSGDENQPDYDTARIQIGQILHATQTFYSNTNWIELNRWLKLVQGEDPNDIVTSTKLGTVVPLEYPRSPEDTNMCKSCIGSGFAPELQNCSNNIRERVVYLTSGYKSGQDAVKPAVRPGNVWGKCSHGGINDASRLEVATGGLNKATSVARRSPHYYLHRQAALTAIQATRDFFYGLVTALYSQIGQAKFRRLLNLDAGTSLTFVIDTTGSMSAQINAVRQECIRLVNLHRETCLAASKYVVSPFNDPDIGPLFVGTNPDECIEFLSGLRANAGGDFPEMAIGGLELGIQNSLNGEKVYFFSDAPDKDTDKLPDVLALTKRKNVQVDFILTGVYSGSRPVPPSYLSVASVSGGQIYRTDNDGIRDLTRIIEGNIRASQVTITRRSSLNRASFSFDIPIDSTTKEILVSVVGVLHDNTVTIQTPQGTSGTPSDIGASIYTSSTAQTVFGIDSTSTSSNGRWSLSLTGLDLSTEFSVKVSANSFLDFNFNIMEIDELGNTYPIDGLPVAGSEVLITVKISSPESVSSVNTILLHDSTGQRTLFAADAQAVRGTNDGLYSANIAIPTKSFFVSIVGVDSEGWEFLRTQPSNLEVVLFKLEKVPGSDSTDDLVPGGEERFSFRIVNFGPGLSLPLAVSVVLVGTADSSAIQGRVEPSSMTLEAGDSSEGTVTITAGLNAPIGTFAKVTLSAQSSEVINFLYTDVMVYEDHDVRDVAYRDRILPRCTILTTGGGCTLSQMGPDCHLHHWWMRFRVSDDRLVAKTKLDQEIGISSERKLGYEEFSLTATTANFSASCCCPSISVTVWDGAGNNASCQQDYYAPVAGQIDKPMCDADGLISVPSDKTPPTCTVLSTGGGCTPNQMGPDCHLHEWWMYFRVMDDTEVADVILDPQINDTRKLIQDHSTADGKTANYSASCCCPAISVTVWDGTGNNASCGRNYYAAVAGEIDKPVCDGPIPVDRNEISDEDDRNSPTCIILSTGGGCTPNQMGPDCHLHEWWMYFRVMDDTEVADVILDPQINDTRKLSQDHSTADGMTVNYSSSCCCPSISVTAQDRAGNIASCGQDYYNPVADQMDKPICGGPASRPRPKKSGIGVPAIVAVSAASAAVIVLAALVVAVHIRKKDALTTNTEGAD